ncbi:MAG: hypothetical protein OXU26_08745 [Acidobacteriota bacterium]|nr:hypothetical protein [Acidobacteriota bacterium]
MSRPATRSTVGSRQRRASGNRWPMQRWASASRFRSAFMKQVTCD